MTRTVLNMGSKIPPSLAAGNGCLGHGPVVMSVVEDTFPTFPHLIESESAMLQMLAKLKHRGEILMSLGQVDGAAPFFFGKFVQLFGGMVWNWYGMIHMALGHGLVSISRPVHFQFGPSNTPKKYKPILSKVLLCEGVSNGPLINFMSWIVKSYGENSFLGSEFTTSLVDIVIDRSCLISKPLVRVGLTITNFCHEKQVDEIPRLITKTDISGLKNKKMKLALQECEAFPTRAWKHVVKLLQQTFDQWNGRFWVFHHDSNYPHVCQSTITLPKFNFPMLHLQNQPPILRTCRDFHPNLEGVCPSFSFLQVNHVNSSGLPGCLFSPPGVGQLTWGFATWFACGKVGSTVAEGAGEMARRGALLPWGNEGLPDSSCLKGNDPTENGYR